MNCQSSEGCISLTSDGWDDHSMRSYIAVTAHYFARLAAHSSRGEKGALKLESELIGFVPAAGHHYGMTLAVTLLFVTDRAGITHKVNPSKLIAYYSH